VLPPKEFFFPPRETVFTTTLPDGKVAVPRPPRRFVLYGLSLHDLEAITYLDEIMSTPEPDYYYFRRRNKALLVGVVDRGIDTPPGGDIIISPFSGGTMRLTPVTEKGREAVGRYLPRARRFRERRRRVRPAPIAAEGETMAHLRRLLMDAERLKDAVKWSWKGMPALWKRLEGECLACGICTYVCPHCHCFSMEDSIDLSGKKAVRCRRWDACTMDGFSKVAGGVDFHPTRRHRYYNWFYHKFVRAYVEFGRSQCVACGRCRDSCPAGIDIEKVLLEITSAYEKARR